MSPQYAATTEVPSERSRAEIERSLTRYGATSFMYGWEQGRAAIQFEKDGRLIRFVLPLPDRDRAEFRLTPTGLVRARKAAEVAYEQAVRQRWRALALVVKAKLEGVEAGIVSFEQEFLAHTVTPDGGTVFDLVGPALERAYETGDIGPLLQIGPAQ